MKNFKISIVRENTNGNIRLNTSIVSIVDDPNHPGQALQYEFDEKYNETLSRINAFVWHDGIYQSLFKLDGMCLYYAISNIGHAIADLHYHYPWIADSEDINVQCRKELEKFADWLHSVGAAFPEERSDLKLMVERGNNIHYTVTTMPG